MSLDIQIKTIVVSFLFGIYFSIFLNLNYKIIHSKKEFIKLIGTLVIIIVNVLLYFLILQKINNGVFHIYEILCILVGFILEKKLHKYVIAKYIKK